MNRVRDVLARLGWWWRGQFIRQCVETSVDGRVRCPGIIGPDGVCDVCGAV